MKFDNSTLAVALQKKTTLVALGVIFTMTLLLTYSNHFDNGFEFDDTHTIVYNEYIRDLKNIPLFFTDISTFGTMPNNRGYRPVVTTLNAIDYWRGRDTEKVGTEKGQLIPRKFHESIMFWYVVQCILMFYLFRHIMQLVRPSNWNGLLALLLVEWYALHPANAETINYIISRSDSFSTLCIVASFVLYTNKTCKRLYLYLIPVIIGIFTKETSVTFFPILFFYVLLFEKDVSLSDLILLKKSEQGKIISAIKEVLPVAILGIALFAFCRLEMTTNNFITNQNPTARWHYFLTQANVISHYLSNFFIPLNLSADPDFEIIRTIADSRVIYGLFILLVLFIISLIISKNNLTRPISFGIIWFYIALAPTSSFHPLGQTANDHRTFYPYIGLILAAGWAIFLLAKKFELQIRSNPVYPLGITILFSSILIGYAYGTHQRNEVWSSSETLWKDVTEKSPKNGRGLMNYGLSLMSKGDLKGAETYFNRAMELLPYYSYLHINMGVLKNAMGKTMEAEEYYKKAIKLEPNNAEAYFYYSKFLYSSNRIALAVENAKRGLEISPGHIALRAYYEKISKSSPIPQQQDTDNIDELLAFDGDEVYFINLTLTLYEQGQFQKCIEACMKALQINPRSKEAYNNMCISYIRLNRYDDAIIACEKALQLAPNFELARNNLVWAKSLKVK